MNMNDLIFITLKNNPEINNVIFDISAQKLSKK